LRLAFSLSRLVGGPGEATLSGFLCGAARGGNFFLRALREGVRPDGQSLLDFTTAQNLHRLVAADETGFAKFIDPDGGAGLEVLLQARKVHNLVADAERILEAEFRDAANQRHLAAFEVRRHLAARAGFRALVALAG